MARSLWFGVLDLAQELVTITSSLNNLIFIYFLALQSLQRAPNIYIQSKSIEVLTVTSTKHEMLNAQFYYDIQNMLKVLEGINCSGNAIKFQTLFYIITQRCLVFQNIIQQSITPDEAMDTSFDLEFFHQNVNTPGNQQQSEQTAIYDLLAAELTCPITQDVSDQFQKLPCGHLLSGQAIKTWSDECKNKKKLFSCCLCRKEFSHEEIQDLQVSAMYEGLYQQLTSVKDISTIQGNNEYLKNILRTWTLAGVTINNNQTRFKDKTPEMIKKVHPAYFKAKAAIKNEEFPVAIFWLNRLLDYWPNSYIIRCERAEVLKQLGDLNQSICDLNIAINFKPKDPYAWNLLGSVYIRMGNHQLALSHVNQALNLEPNNQQSLLTRGIIFIKMKKIDDALQDFHDLLSGSQPTQPTQPVSKVSSIFQMLHFKKPIFNHNMNKCVVECLRKRSELYFDKNKFQLAKQDLDQILQWKPDDRDAILFRGKTYQAMNEFDLAITDFTKVLTMDPENSWVLIRRSTCYAELGKQQEAIDDSNSSLKFCPSNGCFYASRSYIVTFFGDLTQALEYANLSLIIDISDCDNIYRRVWSYFHLQQYNNALCDLHLSAEVDENNALRLALSGLLSHFFENRHEEAFRDFEKAIEIDPDLTDAYCYRGQLYTFRGEYDKALQDLNRATEILPIETYLYQNLGHLYYEMGEYNLALETLDKADHLLPGCLFNYQNKIARSRILTYRGMIYHKLEKYTEALDNFNRAISIQVNNHEVLPIAERGLLYYSMKEFDKSLNDLDEAIKIIPKNDYICRSLRNVYLCRKEIYISRGQMSEAMNETTKLKEIKPILPNRWENFYSLPKSYQEEVRKIQSAGIDLLDEARSELNGEKIVFNQCTFDKILTHWEKAFEIDPDDQITYSVVSGLRLMQRNHHDLIKP